MRTILDSQPNTNQSIIHIKEGEEVQYVIVAQDNFEKHLTFSIEGKNASLQVLGIYIGSENNKAIIDLVQHHKDSNSTSNCIFKTVLKDSSQFDFKGLIKIDKNAGETTSYLTQNTLILSNESRNESLPSLEINADSVEASHSATTGKVSEEEIFYLTSRGLSKPEAEQLLIEGFISSVIEKVKDEKIKNEIIEILKR